MPVSVEQDDTSFRIRLEGEIGVTEAAELKRLLLEGFASRRKVQLDLDHVEEIGVTVMQLLQAAFNQRDRMGGGIVTRMSEKVQIALREAGFAPGVEGAGWSV